MLSKGRRIYRTRCDEASFAPGAEDSGGLGALGRNYSLVGPPSKGGQEAEEEMPADYDVFSDIKQSYERTLAKLVTQVGRLKEEMAREKKERMRCERLADEVTTTEARRVKEIQMRYSDQLRKLVEAEKTKVEAQYAWSLENYKLQNRELRTKLVAQNALVKKLADIVLQNEQEMVNQRFTFYKMCHKDSFGSTLLPQRGANFEVLNRCMLSDSIDALSAEVKNVQGVIGADGALLSALAQVKQAYEQHLRDADELPAEAPLREVFELDRICYNKQLVSLQECIQGMVQGAAAVGESAHSLEVANTRLRQDLRILEHDHKTALRDVHHEFDQKRAALDAKIAEDYAALKDYTGQAAHEIRVKDALVAKLTARNRELEVAVRKAVTIMANPNAMKEAFVRYNLDKIVYADDSSPQARRQDATSEHRASPGSSTAVVPLNTSSD